VKVQKQGGRWTWEQSRGKSYEVVKEGLLPEIARSLCLLVTCSVNVKTSWGGTGRPKLFAKGGPLRAELNNMAYGEEAKDSEKKSN